MSRSVRLDVASEEWFATDDRQQKAASTIRQQRRTIAVLMEVCGPGLPTRKLEAKHINATLDILRKGEPQETKLTGRKKPRKGRSEWSLNTDRGTLILFVKFLYQVGYLGGDVLNPVAGLTYAKRVVQIGAPKRKPLRGNQVHEVLRIAGERHPRDRVMIALALYGGLRSSEIEGLLWRYVKWNEPMGPHIVFPRPKQKGQIHRVPISPALERELRAWFAWYRERHPEMDPNWYVVPARRAAEIHRDVVPKMNPDWPIKPTSKVTQTIKIIKPYLVQVGVTDLSGKGMHTLRRTFANEFYEHTKDIRAVQKALGHATEKTTEQYMDIDQDFERVSKFMADWDPTPAELPANVTPLHRKTS